MKSQTLAVAGAAVAVGGIMVASAVLMTGNNSVDVTTAGSQPAGSAGSAEKPSKALGEDERGGILAAAASDQDCAEDAMPVLKTNTDPRIKAAARSNPASQADPAGDPLDRSAAVEAARMIATPVQQSLSTGGSRPDLTQFEAAAARVPYRVANHWLGGDSGQDSLVAGNRCVWAVTVDAPFEARSAPDNESRPTFARYTVLFDAASGDYLGVSAGTDAADLIAGTRLNAK